MKDFVGNDLQVGDKICYGFVNYGTCRIGIITRFTPKYVFFRHAVKSEGEFVVQRDSRGWPYEEDEDRRYPIDIIKYES